MEQLIEMVLQALRAAGIHCVRALDEETLPRLKAPMVAVGADPSACRQHALARYLGQDADGAERYGMELQATLQLEVHSPGRRAAARVRTRSGAGGGRVSRRHRGPVFRRPRAGAHGL